MRPSLLADRAAPGQESVCGVTTQLFTRTSSDAVSWEALSCKGPPKAINTNTNTKNNFISSSSDSVLLSHVLLRFLPDSSSWSVSTLEPDEVFLALRRELILLIYNGTYAEPKIRSPTQSACDQRTAQR